MSFTGNLNFDLWIGGLLGLIVIVGGLLYAYRDSNARIKAIYDNFTKVNSEQKKLSEKIIEVSEKNLLDLNKKFSESHKKIEENLNAEDYQGSGCIAKMNLEVLGADNLLTHKINIESYGKNLEECHNIFCLILSEADERMGILTKKKESKKEKAFNPLR